MFLEAGDLGSESLELLGPSRTRRDCGDEQQSHQPGTPMAP
jgi:hypothetical protein